MSLGQNFQVNLSGVIRLLSDHLYGGPEVYARELLQNGVDAITARRLLEPDHQGMIRVEVIESEGAMTILVEDNGIGLTEDEVHQFLATIGQSSKSNDFSRDDFIGQFGIGLLSAFVVSDEITVITQSAKEANSAVEWKGRVDGTYSVRKLEQTLTPGTRVYLRAKEGKEVFFDAEKVKDLLSYYGHHLPHKIELEAGGVIHEINEPAPWDSASSRVTDAQLLDYGREVFGIDFLDAIELQSESGGVSGVAYILPFAVSPASRQSHRVYLKRMLLSESVEGLVPDWAFFIRCVVNSNRLRPNAAREAFYEDDLLEQTRAEIGRCLKEHLKQLSQSHREKLDQIIRLHYLPIKALAVEDEEFFRLFIDWLPFETSIGSVTLDEFYREQPLGEKTLIRYVRDFDQFRQIASVAGAQNLCVFNGGYTYDADLLDLVSQEFPGRDVKAIDATDLIQNFQELTLDEQQEIFDLVKLADVVLQKYKCSAEARKFDPDELPTLYTASETATFLRTVDQSKEEADEMWGGILDNVAEAVGNDGYAQLVLNYRNPLVRKLIEIKDRALLKRIIEILYLQSLLLGHYPLSTSERTILGDGLLGLIEHFLGE
ncbi:HSP90 family protein [Stieleria sp. JC731]|uniref:HSP90 family protein n=1 Tax=Pirellulaceae TaxID=2691357 RepID=UPI001E5FAB8C|nr:HSP90 family protein [Stieleria sp. JC731]MCC9598968.1 HSP90 family protein [Stieleria sp. JC731]